MTFFRKKTSCSVLGEEIRGILVQDFALSSWGTQREKGHGDTIERPKSRTGVRIRGD